MWNTAHVMDMINESKNFGIESSDGKLDWKYLKESRDTYITRLNGIYERNLGNSGVQIIQGVSTRAYHTNFLFFLMEAGTAAKFVSSRLKI